MTGVHLYWTEVADRGYEELLPRVRTLLDESELARAARFLFERDRVLFATTHAFLRIVLARHTGGALTFVATDHGKPELTDRRVRFNLSHTRGLVLVGITGSADLGVDVEVIDERNRERGLHSLAARVFTERERRTWTGGAEWFYERWTMKEAYIKARGFGLTLDLQAFGFRDEEPRLDCHPEFDDPAQWQFHTFTPTQTHRAAAAIRVAPGERVQWSV
ncbi:MAG TPA: 4'-phosphopantetheinyl transferase superfamily protein, partial [Thermoanaerobaculia bacterium]